MKSLYLTDGRSHKTALPLDAVTRTFGVLGQRGTGKTNAAVVMVEEMARAGGHVVVPDPVGAWYGLTRAGTGSGLPGIVIGGEHGDVPLEESGGQLVAELVVGRSWSSTSSCYARARSCVSWPTFWKGSFTLTGKPCMSCSKKPIASFLSSRGAWTQRWGAC